MTPLFWLLVVATGIATGLLGDLLMYVLFSVQHIAFGFHGGESFQTAVERSSDVRRIGSLLIAGAFGGIAWFVLRRFTAKESSDLDDEVWNGDGRLSFRRCIGTSLISEVVIGMGASIGREAAPKLMGGAAGSLLGTWARLTPGQRRLLVACGGGAGLAAVYNVPLGGALFTAEVLYGSMSLPVLLPALACSWIATATGWIYLARYATYPDVPSYHFSISLLVFAILLGPVAGVVSTGYVRLIGLVSHHRATGAWALGAPLLAFGLLGLAGLHYPQLFGNGKDIAHVAFLGQGGLGLLAVLLVLKPLVTALCLGSGAQGGLFTPTLCAGALLGACAGGGWVLAWPGSAVGGFAIVGAAAMIGASMQAPITALVLVVELIHGGLDLLVPMMAATAGATAVTRYLDGYSIYSARLPSH